MLIPHNIKGFLQQTRSCIVVAGDLHCDQNIDIFLTNAGSYAFRPGSSQRTKCFMKDAEHENPGFLHDPYERQSMGQLIIKLSNTSTMN